MSLCPVVSCSWLSKNKIIWSENLSIRSRSDWVHGTGFEINQNSAGDVFAAWCFIVVYVDSLQLEIAVAMVGASGINSMLIGNNFPEL